ncbi:MAG TPA: adenylate/guanylate cyclase domain-containing protein [Baekduia sp.]|uniref:adenylate/guanylate cyclase domain-containing protein n=1 Tax=Baekduia sp. TaxID=2600305 RepID=UPI002B69385C|nr:adenylate/guanylate cyclase domain-containing protein [Baekduia sp.]HMJ32515.1 adenylate/guanylate cyclase domain-containing protein [Baekduia sp.]
MEEGRVRWAQSGDANIAYRILGDGPVDLVFLGGLTSHIEVLLEEPGLRRWWERLGAIARVILVDRRGLGMSDRIHGPLTLEEEIADLDAVLDAAGADRVVVQAYAAGGPLAISYAAARPDRTLALVLYASIVATERDEEVTWAETPEDRRARFERLLEHWGTGANLEDMAPSSADDPRMRDWLGRLERHSTTPAGMLRIFENLSGVDVRPLLPGLRVPTLVLHRTGDRLIDVGHSRLLADRIPGARLVELPGSDSLPMIGDTEALLGEIEEFLTGSRTQTSGLQRRLLTVLFTDICDATGHAARMGDARWRDLLSAHDDAIRREVERYGGREVKTVGDGYIAAFAGPPSDALRCARTVVPAVRGLGLRIRAGLHTGECELIGDDVGGMAVHIAARVCDMAAPDEILTSGTVYGTVVGSGLEFEARGAHELRGVPGPWPIFALDH